MGERIEAEGVWQFPQGGVEDGESREEAMWRELTEELGLHRPRRVCNLLSVGPTMRYDFPIHAEWTLARHYRGQEQTLFLIDYHGPDDALVPARVARPEFRRICWVTPTEALRLVSKAKRDLVWHTLFMWLDELSVKA
jgi:putative (di)nucleoside polyphosphate hydrolase